jgi:hypothetical protein|tara:strand:- start:2502 stop:2783 length:282 start_codon:yes stop_codon:yes gene_type:complete
LTLPSRVNIVLDIGSLLVGEGPKRFGVEFGPCVAEAAEQEFSRGVVERFPRTLGGILPQLISAGVTQGLHVSRAQNGLSLRRVQNRLVVGVLQ